MRSYSVILCSSILLLYMCTSVFAASSANYRVDEMIINAGGNTCTGANIKKIDCLGDLGIGQVWSETKSIQHGFFNDYFVTNPTPTVTPTVTVTPTLTLTRTITVTQTAIRYFTGEIMHKDWVYVAPNPIRGTRGNIVFDLAVAAKVELKIFTPQNQEVLSRRWDRLPAGRNRWIWNAANMANGVYILYFKATSNDGKTTVVKKKIALIK